MPLWLILHVLKPPALGPAALFQDIGGASSIGCPCKSSSTSPRSRQSRRSPQTGQVALALRLNSMRRGGVARLCPMGRITQEFPAAGSRTIETLPSFDVVFWYDFPVSCFTTGCDVSSPNAPVAAWRNFLNASVSTSGCWAKRCAAEKICFRQRP